MLRRSSVFTKSVFVIGCFVVGYFVPFFALQAVFLRDYGFFSMLALLRATGTTAAVVNLSSLVVAVLSSLAGFLWLNRPSKKSVKKGKVGKVNHTTQKKRRNRRR